MDLINSWDCLTTNSSSRLYDKAKATYRHTNRMSMKCHLSSRRLRWAKSTQPVQMLQCMITSSGIEQEAKIASRWTNSLWSLESPTHRTSYLKSTACPTFSWAMFPNKCMSVSYKTNYSRHLSSLRVNTTKSCSLIAPSSAKRISVRFLITRKTTCGAPHCPMCTLQSMASMSLLRLQISTLTARIFSATRC